MEYKRIVAVTGLSGLFEVVSSKNDGALLRSLEDGSTKFVSSRVHNLSHLESIEIFTEAENVNLVAVFEALKVSGDPLPDVKDNKALKEYFQKVFPQMDLERVYTSDMKKMVKWYEQLNEKGIEIKLSQPAPEENESAPDVPVIEETAAPAPVAEEEVAPIAAKTPKPKKPAKKKTGEEKI